MFNQEVIAAAAQRRDLLRGGSFAHLNDLSGLVQDRIDVLVDGQLPVGTARTPLLGPKFEVQLTSLNVELLLTMKPSISDLQTAWAIMLNLPLSQSVRGSCISSENMRDHFGKGSGSDYQRWCKLVSEFIRASPHDLLLWLSEVRSTDQTTFVHLLSMDLVRALAERPELETSQWPSSARPAPRISPFHAWACLCEFIRIAQTYRALLHWSLLEVGRDMMADTVVKTIKTSHRPRTRLQIIDRLCGNARLQSLGFGHDVDEAIDRPTLLYRQGVLTLAAHAPGAAGRSFFAPSTSASADELACSMGTHPRYRPRNGTSRVNRTHAITYWGMTYRDFVGVMLLDLADAAGSLEQSSQRNTFYKPERLRRAIVQVELTWLEQASKEALMERLKQISAGARGQSEAVPMPDDQDYSPACVVDCLGAPSGQNFRSWTRKCKQLPAEGSEGSLIRSRPDLWWTGLTNEDLDPFQRGREQAKEAVKLVNFSAPGEFPVPAGTRASGYRSALTDVLASQALRSAGPMSSDPLSLLASADCSLLLSPLSLDPQRSLFNPSKRAMAFSRSVPGPGERRPLPTGADPAPRTAH